MKDHVVDKEYIYVDESFSPSDGRDSAELLLERFDGSQEFERGYRVRSLKQCAGIEVVGLRDITPSWGLVDAADGFDFAESL